MKRNVAVGQQGAWTVTDYALKLLELTREALARGFLTYTSRELRKLDNREAWHAQATPRKEPRMPRSQRPPCAAQTRRGTPCKARVVEGANRCRVHGGLSTGPRTEAGHEAIRVSNRRRAVLADLAELEPAMNEIRRRQWAAAILELAAGGSRAAAGEAAGVTAATIARWCKVPAFDDALTRAGQRLRRRQEAAARSMDTTPAVESTCNDPWTMPDFDLAELLGGDPLEGLGMDFELSPLEDFDLSALDFEPPPLEDFDVEDLLADVGQWVAELPTFDLEKLLDGLPTLEDLDLAPFDMDALV